MDDPQRPAPDHLPSLHPILVFDSGVGGVSVARAIRARLPDRAIVYAADREGFPYGGRTEREIAVRVPALLGRLVERIDPALIVIACNTASTVALADVRSALDRPVVGTVPAVKPAALATATGTIGVLGTAATVRQPYLDRLIAEWAKGITVLRHGAPDLVLAAEERFAGADVSVDRIAAGLAGLLDRPGGERIDTVVLACTHFPLLLAELRAAAPTIRFLDGAAGIARRSAHLLGDPVDSGVRPRHRVVLTGSDPVAPDLARAWTAEGFTAPTLL